MANVAWTRCLILVRFHTGTIRVLGSSRRAPARGAPSRTTIPDVPIAEADKTPVIVTARLIIEVGLDG